MVTHSRAGLTDVFEEAPGCGREKESVITRLFHPETKVLLFHSS